MLTCYKPRHLIKLIPHQAIIIDNLFLHRIMLKERHLVNIHISYIYNIGCVCVSCSMNINEMPFYQHDPFTSPRPVDSSLNVMYMYM